MVKKEGFFPIPQGTQISSFPFQPLIEQFSIFEKEIELVCQLGNNILKICLEAELNLLESSSLNELGIEKIEQISHTTKITFKDTVQDVLDSHEFKQLCEVLTDNREEYPYLVAVIEKIAPMALEYSDDDPGILITFDNKS